MFDCMDRREVIMLEEKDLLAIRGLMEDVIDERVPKMINERVPKIIDECVPDIVNKIVDQRLTESENLILRYVDETRNILDAKITKLQVQTDEMNQYYRVARLENENATLLLKMMDALTRRVEILEERTA